MAASRDDLIRSLRERITTGRIAPGAHLTEVELAQEYAVSRTPVRAALRELASEGLVAIEQNRGAFVTEWTTADAAEVMEIRAMLESHGAALAASRRSEQQLTVLTELCDQMDSINHERPGEYRTRIAELNHDFHLAFLEAASSPRLFNIAKDLALAPIMSGSFHYYSDDELARSLSEHRMIVEAISDRDAARALPHRDPPAQRLHDAPASRGTARLGRERRGRSAVMDEIFDAVEPDRAR